MIFFCKESSHQTTKLSNQDGPNITMNLFEKYKERKMKNTLKNTVILLAAVSLVMLGLNAALASSQSNGFSIYEEGIGKLLSVNDNSGVLVASGQSNGNSIYEDGIDKLLS